MNAIFWVFLTFIGLRYQNKTKTAWIAFQSISRQKNSSKRDERDFSGFFDIHWTKKSKQKQHGLNMVNFQDILDLIDKKCFNGLINGHDVQLGGHKFHKNGKNQKKQSV